ncbi:hypothetical protein BH11PSE1_BH11PSE1_20570 [soil metagenome]
MAEPSSSDGVFINCPFDGEYSSTFDALIFAVFACGFRPRSARELDDASQTRIDKIYGIIEACRYGVHDLSRTELDAAHGLPRFNMPLELGIFLGAKRFGDGAQSLKRCLVLDTEPYRYQKFISDLAGMDIQAHASDTRRAFTCLRDWLANVSRRRSIPGAHLLLATYDRFLADKPIIAAGLGFDPADIPYVDYENMVTTWLLTARP